jgi:glycosyltransferase involved in cell wall biosynthesis
LLIRKPSTAPTGVESTTRAKTPIKVCMLILRGARNDVRSMRAGTTLIKEGFDVSIIDVEHDLSCPPQEDIHGIRVKHMLIPGWYSSRRFEFLFYITALRTFILSLFWLMRSGADIYHAIELNALPMCCIASALRRKPLVYEAYELHIPYPETSIAFWRRSAKFLMGFLALVLPRCAGVIATTPFYAQVMQKRFHLREVTVVRNIPPYKVVQKSDRLKQYLGLSPETRIALYHGSLQRNRGLDKLVRAAAFLEENVTIVLMGNGYGTTKEELAQLVITEGVADRVKFVPPTPLYEDLLDWTVSADIGLILYTASYSLAVKLILPNKLFEYIMAGVPVLATQLDAVEEIIRIYDVGRIIPSVEPKDIGAAINAMLADREDLARMSHNALSAARRDLHWEKESSQVIHLYRNILAKIRCRGG